MNTVCPFCNQHYETEDENNGLEAECTSCGKVFTIAPLCSPLLDGLNAEQKADEPGESVKKTSDKEIACLAAEHQANLIRLAAARAQSQQNYLEMQRQILLLRAKRFSAALEYMTKQSEALAANGEKWAKAIAKKAASPTGGFSSIGSARVSATVKYANVEEGMTLEESIKAASEADAKRISDICRDGVRRDKSLDDTSHEIRGTQAMNYEDGLLNVSRAEARQKTTEPGNATDALHNKECSSANAAKMQFYLENQNVVKGVRFCATLDFTTCLVCAALDGHVWRIPEEIEHIPNLPMCDGCRCVLLPVTELDDAGINSSTRPAAASDFWSDAEKRYSCRFPNKDWSRLSYSTRLKYFYDEQKAYEEATGCPAYDQVPQTMNFSAWLRTKPANIQDRYLGELRAKLFREHGMELLSFVDRRTWSLISLTSLKERYLI